MTVDVSTSELIPMGTFVTKDYCTALIGVDDVLSKYNTTGKISVHFSADSSSILKLEKAESVIELWEEYEVEVPVTSDKDNSTAGANGTNAEQAGGPAKEITDEVGSDQQQCWQQD